MTGSNKVRTLPKSLHTITAIAKVGRYLVFRGTLLEPTDACREAANLLGYPYGTVDPDYLVEKAAATLKAELEKPSEVEARLNAHDELVAALRQLAKEVSLLTNEGDDELVGCAYVDKHKVIRAKGSLLYTIERARAALAKVQA